MTKKEEILNNAAIIIFEEGMQKLTIESVAAKSNLTKGGVLYHFKSKANLLLEMNKRAIEQFEKLWEHYRHQLSGASIITRAYAYATLDFFNEREQALLPAVYISSMEDEGSYSLWGKTVDRWEQLFYKDDGNREKNLKLRLICDGIWFSLMYAASRQQNKAITQTVLNYCELLGEGE